MQEIYDVLLDFDGTCVEHEYPRMGRLNFGCLEIIRKLQDAGHRVILNTYRADFNDGTLEAALDFLNCNPRFEIKPITEYFPNKIDAPRWDWNYFKETKTIWIDDQAFDIPLKPAVNVEMLVVDWDALDKQFVEQGIY